MKSGQVNKRSITVSNREQKIFSKLIKIVKISTVYSICFERYEQQTVTFNNNV